MQQPTVTVQHLSVTHVWNAPSTEPVLGKKHLEEDGTINGCNDGEGIQWLTL